MQTASQCDSAIRFFLYILIFWLPYSSAVIESCVVIAALIWLFKHSRLATWRLSRFRQWRRKEFIEAFNFPQSRLNQSIALFLLACFLSTMFSAFPEQSWRGLISKILEWFVIYFLVVETLTEKRHVRIALAILVFSVVATCLDGIIQFHVTRRDLFFGHTLGIGNGATAGFKTYNDFGGFLTFIVPLAFWMILSTKFWHARFLWSLFFMSTLWSLIITFSRGAWLGVIVGVLFSLLLGKKLWFFILLGFIAIATLLYSLSSDFFPEKSRFTLDSIRNTTQERVEIWRDSIRLIQDRPLSGHGVNTFMMLFQEYRRFNFSPTYAHNCYIQLTAEIGILGLICFSWVIIKIFESICIKMSKFGQGNLDLGCLHLGLSGGVMAFLTQSFFDTNFYSLKLSVLFWFMVGCLISVNQLLTRDVICDKTSPKLQGT